MVDDVMAIPSWATVLVAAEYFVNHRLLAFPVVETSGKLVGVVDVTLFNDDVIALAKQSFDGIFQLLGIHATQALTPWAGFKDRFPWLLCNIAGGLLCAVLASHFEELLNVAVVLALFIPVVLALAESVSIQSVTLTLQNLQSGRIHWGQFGRALFQEALTALMLGSGCGALVAVITWVWKREALVSGDPRRRDHGVDAHGLPLRSAAPHPASRRQGRPQNRRGPDRARADRPGGAALLLHRRGHVADVARRTGNGRYATARGITSSSRVSTAIRGSHLLSIARNFLTRSGSNSSPARSSM